MVHPIVTRGRAERWSTESEAAGLAKRNPSIVIEARSSSLSLAESNESNGAAVVHSYLVVQRNNSVGGGGNSNK